MPKFGTSGGAAAGAWRAKGRVATFILANDITSVAGLSSNISWAGAASGDVGIIVATFVNANTPAGWTRLVNSTWTTYGYTNQVYWKILSAGDVASGTTITYTDQSGIIMNAAYRGASAVFMVDTPYYTTSGGSSVMAGFTKNVADRRIVSYCVDRDSGNVDTISPGWTKRISPQQVHGFFTGSIADITPNQYGSGSAVTWSNSPATQGTACQMLEVR